MKYPNELRADLQRIYGINLDDVGKSVSVKHTAACVRCLPLGSLVLEKQDPRYKFTETEWLLLGILNSLRKEPLDPFTTKEESGHIALSIEELDEFLTRPRKEVEHG